MKSLRHLFDSMHQEFPQCSFRVRLWDGDEWRYGEGEPEFILEIRSNRALKRIVADSFLGFGESYMAGEVDLQGNMQRLFQLALGTGFDGDRLSRWQRLRFLWEYLRSKNSARKARINVTYHYDKGNDFYSLWLDKSMTYSCAYFRSPDDDLETAQNNKHEHICRKLSLKEGETLVDVGCGWGSMLIYAAQHYGVSGVGCTLSKKQCDYARERIRSLGLDKQVTVLCEDYRTLKGQFDKFVSIGMFEHVGKQFYPVFMRKVASLLKPGGLGLLHTIGKDVASPPDPWTIKYIFPGGYIPVLDEITYHLGVAGFSMLDMENLRLHYALTLDHWAERFEQRVEQVRKMFNEQFVRMWRLFLNGSSAGFKWGETRLFQITFSNGLNSKLPLTREYIYR